MIALRRSPTGALVLAVLAGCPLAGCSGGSSTSVSCSGSTCRATVSGAPVEVTQPDANQSTRTRSSTPRRPPRNNDGVDFGVNAIGPGWVDVEDDGTVTRIPQGGSFVEDSSTVRLESSDGRTAVFTFTKR
ncbi:hypothetical protein Acsp06_01790 [Actinomycetospora sp. NBRC 106375]|uniref:hypothetical protein n=1 Tax=Actinomycetospora sp. NBRC 106375 TaxID=3032207 RepID=UPI0024A0096B|nr:hypothetical protein [Actinomycetospora sp. NBRC 106375]GLZ43994.1 hypothetical protein Acsp06_01790 [Actinomycetospora sp. NBRC 106375]